MFNQNELLRTNILPSYYLIDPPIPRNSKTWNRPITTHTNFFGNKK